MDAGPLRNKKMIISLNLIREHTHFTEDDLSDELLTQYYNAAVGGVQTYCHRVLVSDTDPDAIATSEEAVPAEIKQWLLVVITDFCEKRERISDKTLSTYHNHLLDNYILY